MKLNWAERLVVNNPLRVFEQRFELGWLTRCMKIDPGGAILEIGCGRGAGARTIRDEFKPRVLCAMDLDLQMIRRAVKYLGPLATPEGRKSEAGSSGLEEAGSIGLYTGDANFLPHPDAAFDAVFGFGVLHHVPDWCGALGEIARVLRPGGVYYLEELYPSLYQNFITKHVLLHPTEDRFGSGDLRRALDTEGFSLIDALEVRFIGILAVLAKKG